MQMNKWDTEEGETWWRKVSGPKEYLKQVESLIRNGKCVLLQMEDVDTTFFQILRDRLLRSDSSLTFTVMDTAGCASSTDFLAALSGNWGLDAPRGSWIPTAISLRAASLLTVFSRSPSRRAFRNG